MLITGTLQNLPYFTKKDLIFSFVKSKSALNHRIEYLLKNHQSLQFKKGLYVTSEFYFAQTNKIGLAEFISSKIYFPSYISLEYALKKYNLLTDPPKSITCVTTKTTRSFKNLLGVFQYSNIKPLLFSGFEKIYFNNYEYHVATRGKALFDYLYLRSDMRGNIRFLKKQLFESLGINWANFSRQDFEEFDKHVWKSNSHKMMKIWHIINEYFADKEFDKWAHEILE